MMLTMCKGLPASGKTTWAKKQLATRINKDDLRAMMHDGIWTKGNEHQILAVRDAMIVTLLARRLDVIVDDTNLAPKHEARLSQLAQENGARFEVKDFTEVSLDTCLHRNRNRLNPVPDAVILDMYNQFLKVPIEPPPYDRNLPDAIIVDIDGTLALNTSGRSPYDWHRVGEDEPNVQVVDFVNDWWDKIILMSGRDSVCRDETIKWLSAQQVDYDCLHMRPEGDTRKDAVVKRELYETHIKGKYNVSLVLDDRDQVVRMWRDELGLQCWQVAYGNF